MSIIKKFLLIFSLSCVFILGVGLQQGTCQFLYPPVMPFYAPMLPPPLPLFPAPFPIAPVPFIRTPAATIILSTGLTAVSPTTGALVVGAPTVVSPTVVTTAVPTVTTAAPAPLFGTLASLYASALYESPLSVANPLLFAYLTTILI